MSNKKLIIGIAAGVAALAVVGIILKRKGHLDGIIGKAEELTGDLADKYQSVKETARKKFDEVVQKGGEIADKIKSHSDAAADTKAVPPATA
jgi:gas vesicle protein